MANSVDLDQAAEMVNNVEPDQTVSENDSVDLDLDQNAENGK